MIAYTIISFAIGALVTGLGTLWWLYSKSYFTKSGELRAIEESLEKVTKLTESIKGELDVISKRKIYLQEIHTNCILDLHSSFTLWYQSIAFMHYEKIADYDLFMTEMKERSKDFHFALSKFMLLFNKQIKETNTVYNLMEATQDFGDFMRKIAAEFKMNTPKSDLQLKQFRDRIMPLYHEHTQKTTSAKHFVDNALKSLLNQGID